MSTSKVYNYVGTFDIFIKKIYGCMNCDNDMFLKI
jgi:hypothetical protein